MFNPAAQNIKTVLGSKSLPMVPEDNKAMIEDTVASCLRDPEGHPIMTYAEAACAIKKSGSTVRRLCDQGDLKKGGAVGTVLTKSVLAYLHKDRSKD